MNHPAVTDAVGVYAVLIVMFPVEVPAVGLTLIALANVADAVFAIVPNAFRYSDRPTGFTPPLISHPGGIEHTVFVPSTPVYAAIVVYVFFVTAVGRVYSSSAWVPVMKLKA